LLATISEILMPIAGFSPSGDTNGRGEIVEFFNMVLEAIKASGLSPGVIQFRGDVGTVCEELLCGCEGEGKVRYAFAVPGNRAFQARLGASNTRRCALGSGFPSSSMGAKGGAGAAAVGSW
jgi:hypothetical protein